jgi:phenylalanyl-tRNA synthetase beta chain
MRGVSSNGMLCSAEELGFSESVVPLDSKDGIWILSKDEKEFTLGAKIVSALSLVTSVVDFEITSNRPDCLSFFGMAREAAATFDLPMNGDYKSEHHENKDAQIHIEIKDSNLCPRYTAQIIRGVQVKPSPFWLKITLMLSGVRPINNIVDITNYIMLETGNPIHAFDISLIEGGKIIIETAKYGEHFTTLDEKERTLDDKMLLIKDAKKAVAIAGVMGGLNSEITNETKDILIESASFNADSVRRTSKLLGLRTEASSRYEKGVTPELADIASREVTRLVQELAGGVPDGQIIDAYPKPTSKKEVKIRVKRVNQILGINLTAEDISKILLRLNIKTEITDGELICKIPFIRVDLNEEIDMVEEICRIYGFDNFENTLPKGNTPVVTSPKKEAEDFIKEILYSLSFTEMLSYSFVSPGGFDAICLPASAKRRNAVKIINPLGDETSILRTLLLPNVLTALAHNFRQKNERADIFELGNIFITEEVERRSLSFASLTADFYNIKGRLETLFQKLDLMIAYKPTENGYIFHFGKAADVYITSKNPNFQDIHIGTFGALHPFVVKNYKLKGEIIAGEFNIEEILKYANFEKNYKPLPKFPALSRDVSFIVPEKVSVQNVADEIIFAGKKNLEKNELVDIYRGEQVGEGKKSLSFRQTYRAFDRTLTDEEVQKIEDKFTQKLDEKYGAILRDK